MMRRETAYRMAGRNHFHDNVLDDALRVQDLIFASPRFDQARRAFDLLRGLEGLDVLLKEEEAYLVVRYDLAHHSLRSIENFLERNGFVLEDTLVSKLKRTLAHFCEDTMARNAKAPQRLIKQSNQVYVKAYDHHPHGDRDETPVELREIK